MLQTVVYLSPEHDYLNEEQSAKYSNNIEFGPRNHNREKSEHNREPDQKPCHNKPARAGRFSFGHGISIDSHELKVNHTDRSS